ncbi:MAG: hypothetical protein WA940_00215 [Sphingopyxis sp.]
MAYGDYDGPDKPNKGKEGGACNRQRCQAEPALWWNHGSHSWYCRDCAIQIGDDPVNKRDWTYRWEPKCGHPQFETRDQIDTREYRRSTLDGTLEMITAPYFGWARGRTKPQSGSLKRLLAKAKGAGQ